MSVMRKRTARRAGNAEKKPQTNNYVQVCRLIRKFDSRKTLIICITRHLLSTNAPIPLLRCVVIYRRRLAATYMNDKLSIKVMSHPETYVFNCTGHVCSLRASEFIYSTFDYQYSMDSPTIQNVTVTFAALAAPFTSIFKLQISRINYTCRVTR